MNFKIEICVDSINSALNAQSAGADRIELCDNLFEGGTTPGYGTLVSIRNNLNIGLNVIIRPRGGDFLYSDLEYEIMRKDIDICGELGADGVVLGILHSSGEIDVDRTSRLIEMARPMSVTFHRAFDMCSNPGKGLENIISTGADRLLTSGMKDNAAEGAELIKQLVIQAGNRIIIMPGGGINESNIASIARVTGAKEFHFTGRKVIDSEMIYRKGGVTMGGSGELSEYSTKVASPEIIKNVIHTLNSI